MAIKNNPFNFKRGYGTQEESITMGVPTIPGAEAILTYDLFWYEESAA